MKHRQLELFFLGFSSLLLMGCVLKLPIPGSVFRTAEGEVRAIGDYSSGIFKQARLNVDGLNGLILTAGSPSTENLRNQLLGKSVTVEYWPRGPWPDMDYSDGEIVSLRSEGQVLLTRGGWWRSLLSIVGIGAVLGSGALVAAVHSLLREPMDRSGSPPLSRASACGWVLLVVVAPVLLLLGFKHDLGWPKIGSAIGLGAGLLLIRRAK